MNHHHARVELSAESVASTAELIKLDSYVVLLPCCYRAAAELNSSYLFWHGSTTTYELGQRLTKLGLGGMRIADVIFFMQMKNFI